MVYLPKLRDKLWEIRTHMGDEEYIDMLVYYISDDLAEQIIKDFEEEYEGYEE